MLMAVDDILQTGKMADLLLLARKSAAERQPKGRRLGQPNVPNLSDLFMNVLVEGGSFKEILRGLSLFTSCPTALFSCTGELQARAELQGCPPGLAECDGWIGEQIRSLQLLDSLQELRDTNGVTVYLSPVGSNRQLFGYIALIALLPGNRPGKEQMMALRQASAATAIAFSQQRARTEVERRYRKSFVTDLLSQGAGCSQSLLEQGRTLGYDLSCPYVSIIFAHESGSGGEAHGRGLHNLLELVEAKCGGSEAITADVGGTVVCLLKSKDGLTPGEAIQMAATFARTLAEEARPTRGTVLSGVGQFARTPQEIPRSYQEAQHALQLGRIVWEQKTVFRYDSLGIFRVLFQVGDQMALHRFCDEYLGPLIAYDRQHNRDLVNTLQSLFRNDLNSKRCAAAMFVHPNTINYRIRRIEELTASTLSNTEACFNLQVACKIHLFLTNSHGLQTDGSVPTQRSKEEILDFAAAANRRFRQGRC